MRSTRFFAARISLPLVRRVLGTCVVVLAVAVMAGWLFRSEILAIAAPGFGTMLFGTALCLALLGGGVLLMDGTRAWHREAIFTCGAVVITLTGLTLYQHATGFSVGVDFPELHRWLAARSPTPGRMTVGTSFALLLLGIALCLWPQAARRHLGLTIQLLTIFAMVIAVFGIIIRELQLQYLYSAYVFSTMALHTALGVITVGMALWLAWQATPWNRLLTFNSDEQRIKSSGTVILLVIAISVGFFGFYASRDALETNLTDSHMRTLRARVQQVETVLDHHLTQAGTIANRLDLQEQLHRADRNPDDAGAIAKLTTIAESWTPSGFSGIIIYDATGREVVRTGKFVGQTALALAIGANRRARLSWSDGFHMRSEVTVFHDGEAVGRVVTEQRMHYLTGAMLDLKDFGETGDIELCARADGRANCFPTRLNNKPYLYPPVAQRLPQPIYRALDGETGYEFGFDNRGIRVFAAYTPVADYGFGMVMKISLVELAAPVRRELENTLPIVVLLVIVGIMLLDYLVHPLAQRLARREQQLKLALNNSKLALWDWNISTDAVYLSEQWQTIIGGPSAVTLTTQKELQKLMYPDDMPEVAKAIADTLKNGTPYDVEHRVLTCSGEWKWIHSVGNVAERDARGRVLRMNGTNADIGMRKQTEAQLAHQATHDLLSGLPNRSLFQTRLARAMARAQRQHTLMAVMYLDIDKFKSINDTLGHATGDALLKAFAQRLEHCVRAMDTVARLGGDEFAVILEQLSDRDAGRHVAEKIVTAMHPEFTLENRTLSITTSVGMAFYSGEDGISADSIVKKADEALYAAKGAGRNNYQIAA